jgi:hypothetical protein
MQDKYPKLKIGDRVLMIEDAYTYEEAEYSIPLSFAEGTVVTVKGFTVCNTCPYKLLNKETGRIYAPVRRKYVLYVDKYVVGGDYYDKDS